MAKVLTIPVPSLPAEGLDPLHVARNEVPVSATHVNPLVSLVNSVGGRRMKVLFTHHTNQATTPSAVNWRFQAHTSPNCNAIIVDTVFDTSTAAATPYVEWETTPIGGAARTQDPILVPYNPGASSTPAGYVLRRQIWTDLDGSDPTIADTTFRAEMTAVNVFPRSCTIYEGIRETYDIFSPPSMVQIPSGVVQGAHIYRGIVTTLHENLDQLWERQGQTVFNWTQSVTGTGVMGAAAVTGTSYENILGSSFSAYNAAAPGYWFRPKDRGTRTTNTVPVRVWCYADETDAGGDINFDTDDGSLGTISGITAAGWYSTDLTLDARVDEVKIDVLARASGVAEVITVRAVGMYEYQA